MKFPKRTCHKGRGPVLVTTYRRPDSTYRADWQPRVDDKPVSRTKDFLTFAELAKDSTRPRMNNLG